MSNKTKAKEFVDDTYKIHVTGRNVLVTDGMKNHAIDKIAKIERFSDRIIDVVVTMDIQKLEHRVDIVIKVDHIKIKSHAATNDMYVSIDQAVAKIERQLQRYKKKIQEHQTKKLSIIDMNVNVFHAPAEEELMDVNEQIDDANRQDLIARYSPHQVVSRESRALKMLTIDEAIMKMELSGNPFLIYISEEDQKIKVIYRRKDGNYGVIEPEK